MKNCALCSTPLKFLNTPLGGSSKLNDGSVLCTRCTAKVGYSVSLKNYSLTGLQELLEQKAISRQEKIAQSAHATTLFEERKATEEEARTLHHERKAIEEDEKKSQKAEQKAQKIAAMEERWQQMKSESNAKKQNLAELKAHIKTLPIDNLSGFLGRKEINELPNILSAGEEIDNIIQGRYNEGFGILVSTNRRLIFIDKGLLFGLKVEDFPLDKISSIQFETGLLTGKVKIYTSGNMASIDSVQNTSARQFSDFVRNKLSIPQEKQQAPNVVINQQQPDVLEQLEKLGRLKASGIISEAEFEEQKAKLLAKL